MTPPTENKTVRATLGLGQVFVILGVIFLYGIGIYWLTGEVILNPEGEFPWFVRIGLPLVVGGVTILLVIALLQRLKAAKHDKYTDVVD